MSDSELTQKTLYIEAAFEIMGRSLPITDGRTDAIKALAITAMWAGQNMIPDYEMWAFIMYPEARPVQWPPWESEGG